MKLRCCVSSALQVRREIRRRFARLLKSFTDENGDAIYKQRVREMVTKNLTSLEVNYLDIANTMPVVAIWLADHPREMLPILSETAMEVAVEEFADYGSMKDSVFVRIANIPLQESIRDLRHFHLNQLVRVDGVVTRRTGVYPQLQRTFYDCMRCGAVLGPYFQTGDKEIKLGSCPSCETKGPFTVNAKETVYRNYQKITLQEAPGSVPAGRLPRSKEVILLHDLVDSVRPGEEVIVTGIYQHSFEAAQNARHGFPVYSVNIEANHIQKKGDQYSAARLTDDDKAEIRALARDPRIGERIVKSIAPSIYGHQNIKQGIALALFGGQEKHPSATHRLRGDINMLLLGDPGTAKSQFLKYVEKVAHRAVYTTGKGASAVGLTAAVHKDAITGEWTLEGGALVLADRGVCLIDEFDKMNDQDRVSIHEVGGPACQMQRVLVASIWMPCDWRGLTGHQQLLCNRRMLSSGINLPASPIPVLVAGHGAAVNLHLQGRHRHPAAGALLGHCGGQPHWRAVRRQQDLQRECGAD
jgi:DNA replication licensing factor MCM2